MLANEKWEVKLESAREVKIEGNVKEKKRDHAKELSEEKSMSASTIVERKERKQSFIAKFKDVRRVSYCTNNLNLALYSISCFVQVKRCAIVLMLSCSIPTSIEELKSFHRLGVLSVKSLCSQQVIKFSSRVDVLVDQPLDISKGVTLLESYSIVPYHSSNDTPLLPFRFSKIFKSDSLVSFEGIVVDQGLPIFTNCKAV